MFSLYVALCILLVWAQSSVKVGENICEYSHKCKRYVRSAVKNTKKRWAPPHNTILFSYKLSKAMKTPEYLWLHPVTTCPQVGYDDILVYSWDHFSQPIHVWCLQAKQRAFSWELEKNSWELSKTLQSFFKHPFLKLSFYSFPPNFLGQVLPALHTVSDKMQMSNIISSVP